MKEIFNPDPSIFREYVPDIAAFLEEEKVPGESVICDGKISHTGKSSYIEQFEYLKSILPAERHGEIKMTLAAPNWYHLRYKEGQAYPKEVYASDEEYFADIAEAYRTELKILYDAGLRNAQVDDPNLACKPPPPPHPIPLAATALTPSQTSARKRCSTAGSATRPTRAPSTTSSPPTSPSTTSASAAPPTCTWASTSAAATS